MSEKQIRHQTDTARIVLYNAKLLEAYFIKAVFQILFMKP
jgi:hypothetical protein